MDEERERNEGGGKWRKSREDEARRHALFHFMLFCLSL